MQQLPCKEILGLKTNGHDLKFGYDPIEAAVPLIHLRISIFADFCRKQADVARTAHLTNEHLFPLVVRIF